MQFYHLKVGYELDARTPAEPPQKGALVFVINNVARQNFRERRDSKLIFGAQNVWSSEVGERNSALRNIRNIRNIGR
jgi:hypothetical protein